MLYPGATPEFRILKQPNGEQTLQVRYVNITQGYTSKWQDVPVIEAEERKVA
jgi:hypothetical protein